MKSNKIKQEKYSGLIYVIAAVRLLFISKFIIAQNWRKYSLIKSSTLSFSDNDLLLTRSNWPWASRVSSFYTNHDDDISD